MDRPWIVVLERRIFEFIHLLARYYLSPLLVSIGHVETNTKSDVPCTLYYLKTTRESFILFGGEEHVLIKDIAAAKQSISKVIVLYRLKLVTITSFLVFFWSIFWPKIRNG